MSYAPRPGELPDDVNTRHNEVIYRCAHCMAESVLHWHSTQPGIAQCSRSECGEALNERYETIAAEVA